MIKYNSVVEHLYNNALNMPEKICVIAGENKLTYAELLEEAARYARYLKKSGVKKGDIVLTRASQDIKYVIIYFGIHLSGGIVTSLERSTPIDELKKIANQLNAKFLILNDNETLTGDYVLLNSCYDDTVSKKPFNKDEFGFPSWSDSADILFTTGTTGASKGVELSHGALVATAENLIVGCGYKKDTFLILPGPLNHANAIRKLFTTVVNGSSICILNGITNLKAFYSALDMPLGIKACCLPPAAIRTIFALTKDRLGLYADKIDFIESASAPLPESDKLRLCDLLPKTRLYNNYGSSEAASVCMFDYSKHLDKKGCIGKCAVNSKVIIVDDDRKEIDSDKDHMGFLACVGDVNMKGYYNDPITTKEVLTDGIVYTNDLGYKDSDGFIYIAGRKGDVINVGGFKIAPSDVEEAVLGMDDIDDCICIAVDDKVTGQALKLLVVLHDGAKLDIQKIAKYLSLKVEAYKVPRFFEAVDKVERTYNGKLNRKFYR